MAQEPVAVVTANDDPQPKDASLCIAIKPADAVVTAQSQPRGRVQRLLKKGGKFFPRMSPMQVCQTLRFLHSQDLIQQETQAVEDALAAAVAAPTTELRVEHVSLDSDGDESERVRRRPSPSPFDNGTRPFGTCKNCQQMAAVAAWIVAVRTKHGHFGRSKHRHHWSGQTCTMRPAAPSWQQACNAATT